MPKHPEKVPAFVELKCRTKVLKVQLNQEEFRLGRDAQWSDFTIPATGWKVLSRRHAIFRQDGDRTYLIDGDGQTPSRNGFFLNNNRVGLSEPLLLRPGMSLTIGQNPKNSIQCLYRHGICHPAKKANRNYATFLTPDLAHPPIDRMPPPPPCATPTANGLVDSSSTGGKSSFSFAGKTARKTSDHLANYELDLKRIWRWPIVIGREKVPHCTSITLDAPTVSRRHATLKPNTDGKYILCNNSTNGTFVNYRKIEKERVLKEGDELKFGPYKFCFRQGKLKRQGTIIDAW